METENPTIPPIKPRHSTATWPDTSPLLKQKALQLLFIIPFVQRRFVFSQAEQHTRRARFEETVCCTLVNRYPNSSELYITRASYITGNVDNFFRLNRCTGTDNYQSNLFWRINKDNSRLNTSCRPFFS